MKKSKFDKLYIALVDAANQCGAASDKAGQAHDAGRTLVWAQAQENIIGVLDLIDPCCNPRRMKEAEDG